MKRSRKVLSWIAGIVLASVVVMLILVATFDWNRMKPFIGDKVSQAIGRPFAINGELTVDWRRDRNGSWPGSWLPWPEFTARDISIANPDWATQPQFAHLDALRFRLSPLPLLTHRIDVPTLQLVHPTADLERDKSGRASWDFALPENTAPSAWKLQLGTIGFDQGLLTLDDAASRVKLKLVVEPLQAAIPYDQIVAQQSSAAREEAGKTLGAAAKKTLASGDVGPGPEKTRSSITYQFGWTAEGSYQGSPLKGKGRTGAVLALQDTTTPFPLQADVRIGDSRIALVGTLTDPLHLGALDVRLWLSGSSMARLYPITGITLPDTPPYATEGHLKAELHRNGSHYSYQDFRGRVGGSDLAGNLMFVTGGKRPKLSGDVH
jgi:AsmA family protein